MAVLVLADHDQGELSPATARVVAAAAGLGEVHILVAASAPDGIAEAAAGLAGVSTVWVAGPAVVADTTAESLAALLERLAPDYTHVIAAAATAGRDVIPRLAARLDLMPVTDVIEILGPDRFVRPVYAGNALETVRSPQPKQLLTVRAASFRPALRADAPAPVSMLAGEAIPPSRVTATGEERSEGGRPDLATAPVVVSGGIAFGSAGNFALVTQLAEALGAAVGATRTAVDAGYAPNDWQVGQTGKIIAPDLYVAVGISGALQHLAGIQGAKKIVAINTDPEAPLMQLADLRLVADLNAAVPALIAALQGLGVGR